MVSSSQVGKFENLRPHILNQSMKDRENCKCCEDFNLEVHASSNRIPKTVSKWKRSVVLRETVQDIVHSNRHITES